MVILEIKLVFNEYIQLTLLQAVCQRMFLNQERDETRAVS